jgi:hypothetical protein
MTAPVHMIQPAGFTRMETAEPDSFRLPARPSRVALGMALMVAAAISLFPRATELPRHGDFVAVLGILGRLLLLAGGAGLTYSGFPRTLTPQQAADRRRRQALRLLHFEDDLL